MHWYFDLEASVHKIGLEPPPAGGDGLLAMRTFTTATHQSQLRGYTFQMCKESAPQDFVRR